MRMTHSAMLMVFVLALASGCKNRGPSPEAVSTTQGAEEAFQNLGPQVLNVALNTGAVATIENTPYLFTVLQGDPAMLVVVDLDAGTVKKQIPLADAIVSWVIKIAANNQIYIGTTSQGRLFRYTPFADKVEELGTPIGAQAIWDLEWVDQRRTLFGGVSDPGKLFTLENGQFKSHGVAQEGEMILRSLAYDPALDRLYAGIGTHARLVEYELKQSKKTEILPAEFKSDSFVYDLNVINGRLFAKMEPSYRLTVIETKTRKQLTTFQCTSRGVSPLSPLDDKVYFTNGGKFSSYDFSENRVQELDITLKDNLANFAFVKLKDPNFSDETLVGLAGSGGKLFKYNLKTGYHEVTQLTLPPQAVVINEIGAAHGKIYSGGYVTGGVGIFDPKTEKSTSHPDISQTEALVALGDKVYFAAYPKARIYEYDPRESWVANQNPKVIVRLDVAKQNRPLSAAVSEDQRLLFVGTAPEYGHLGGALAVYHQDTNELETHTDIIPDQSIAAIVYKDGYVIGGTSAWGGEGITPKATTMAKLFVWDVKQKKKNFETVPHKTSIISTLVLGPDKNIWGMAGGTLFIFDLKQKKIVFTKELFASVLGRLKAAKIGFHQNGMLYGTVNGSLFSVDPGTKKLTILRNNVGAGGLAFDGDGNVFFKIKNALWRYKP